MTAIGFTTEVAPIEPRKMRNSMGVPFTADCLWWSVGVHEDDSPSTCLTYFGRDADGERACRIVYSDSRGFPVGHPQPPQWALDALAEAWAEWDERQDEADDLLE